MPRKEYLSQEARQRFDWPPILSAEQKLIFLQAPLWAHEYVRQLQTPSNKVGFLLQVGYFRIVSKFFVPGRFLQDDVDFVTDKISVDVNAVEMADYEGNTARRHQKDILEYFGFSGFDKSAGEAMLYEAERLAHVQTRPHLIFQGMVSFLQEHHIEIPTYQTIKTILDKALVTFESNLEAILTRNLTPDDTLLLDNLLNEHQSYEEDLKKHLKVKRYEITFFKRISQSMETKHIHERQENFQHLKGMFLQIVHVARRLRLSDSAIQYYAEYVINNQIPQIASRGKIRYLLLIAFVIHQYYLLGDALILTLNSAVTSFINGCEEDVKLRLYESRLHTAQLVQSATHRSITHIDVLRAIETIIADTKIGPQEKITAIDELLKKKRLSQKLLAEDGERLRALSDTNQKVSDREDYYTALETGSSKLSGKVSDIIKMLVPSSSSSDKDVLTALEYYRERNGTITQSTAVPTAFLDMEEQQRVLTTAGKLRPGLYKVFLFKAVKDSIKSGAIAIDSSYDYRAFEEYEIPASLWQKEKENLLERAGLLRHSNSRVTLLQLNEKLNTQVRQTNEHIALGENKQVSFDTDGGWHLAKDKSDEDSTPLEDFYPQEYVIPLLEVLTTVENAAGFTAVLTHQGIDYVPKRPELKLFLAAIVGFGCNIGIRRFSYMSKGIKTNALETTALQYFSVESVIQANDKLLAFSNGLPLTEHFKQHVGFTHTSSDGQKFDVSVESLASSPSFKYFGNGRGITLYSFLDESGQLFYSTAFSAAEPESHYVLDGLTHNEVILPDAHSTDTHGFSEPVFAVTGLLGIEFRPRFARFHHQQLYAINEPRTYREQGYKICPDFKINLEHLENHWDDILRLVCTIKLGYAKSSTLFRRLNSYSKQHPIYKALKDLGRLYKTAYIYQYMDDQRIRKSVSGALSRIESSNNFAKAITLGNNRELIWATRKEQLIAEGCKRLIANAINTYNLLLLSEKLVQTADVHEKKILLDKITQTSTHRWAHINLAGEYDFSDGQAYRVFDFKVLNELRLTPEN